MSAGFYAPPLLDTEAAAGEASSTGTKHRRIASNVYNIPITGDDAGKANNFG
jgi:hypothetical protein